MTTQDLQKLLLQFENASTALHEYFYEVLQNKKTYEFLKKEYYDKKSDAFKNSPPIIRQRLSRNTCTVRDFMDLINFFNQNQS